MPTTTYFSETYVTPFDPAYVDLWGPVLNNLHIKWDECLGKIMVSGVILYPEASVDYPIIYSARFPGTVESVKLVTNDGTLTANTKINSTSITSLDSVSVSSTGARTSSTGAKTMAADDDLFLNLSSITSAVTRLSYSYYINRTGAGT